MHKNIPVLVLLFAFTFGSASPAAAQSNKNNDQRQNFLLSFFDQNEGAALYHRYCGGKQPAPPRFRENHDRVGQILLNELIRQSPDIAPQMIHAALKERQNDLRYNLEKFYMQNSCAHPEAVNSKNHYETLIATSLSELEDYISAKLTVAH